ncbi:serine hydrolase domain-containing protein [Chamaesiphon sp.]|uniref:serine hydrolase domain-containing protein n=1 Tax=Chamaesiphon sp. TaxID=2814140 RepID=UPI0035941488
MSQAVVARQPAVSQPAPLQAIDVYLESKLKQYRIPGLAIAIVQGDRIIHSKGFGIADSEKRPVTPETPFILGSVSKSFTALAIMQLVEASKVNLDAPVQQYLPWFNVAVGVASSRNETLRERNENRQASSQITVRHLLNQVSGISTRTGRKYIDRDTGEGAIEKYVRNLNADRLSQPVGKKFQYSNANYIILGAIVQAISGMSYERYIQQYIFTPLEMRHSYTSQQQSQQGSPALSVGNRFWFGYPVWTEVAYIREYLPSGNLIASVEDLGHYLIPYLNDGRYQDINLVSSVRIAQLHQPAAEVGDRLFYGMGWFVRSINNIPIVSHGGEAPNYSSNITLIPTQKLGFALLINVIPGVAGEPIRQLSEGIVNLLTDRPPVEGRNSFLTQLQVIAFPALLMLQLLGLFRTWIVLRQWRTRSKSPHLDVKSLLRHVGLPLILDAEIAAGLLIGLPMLFEAPLPVMLVFQPDLIGIAMISATLALVGGLLRAGVSLQLLLT